MTHKCYRVISGVVIFDLGRAPGEDGKKYGGKIKFEKGDVFVLPVSDGTKGEKRGGDRRRKKGKGSRLMGNRRG